MKHAPRSELEALLQRIAPDKEVMIGISNYNLVDAGEMPAFLEVRTCCLVPVRSAVQSTDVVNAQHVVH